MFYRQTHLQTPPCFIARRIYKTPSRPPPTQPNPPNSTQLNTTQLNPTQHTFQVGLPQRHRQVKRALHLGLCAARMLTRALGSRDVFGARGFLVE